MNSFLLTLSRKNYPPMQNRSIHDTMSLSIFSPDFPTTHLRSLPQILVVVSISALEIGIGLVYTLC